MDKDLSFTYEGHSAHPIYSTKFSLVIISYEPGLIQNYVTEGTNAAFTVILSVQMPVTGQVTFYYYVLV